MEDWSYAGSWEKNISNVIPTCSPTTHGGNLPSSETAYDMDQLRSFTYLIEAADQKTPRESSLGNPEAIENPCNNLFALN